MVRYLLQSAAAFVGALVLSQVLEVSFTSTFHTGLLFAVLYEVTREEKR